MQTHQLSLLDLWSISLQKVLILLGWQFFVFFFFYNRTQSTKPECFSESNFKSNSMMNIPYRKAGWSWWQRQQTMPTSSCYKSFEQNSSEIKIPQSWNSSLSIVLEKVSYTTNKLSEVWWTFNLNLKNRSFFHSASEFPTISVWLYGM